MKPKTQHLVRREWRSAPVRDLRRARGFTLVELVVALTISAILVGFIAMFVSAPVDAYFDQSDRAQLSDAAEVISRRFNKDLRSALPNSVRIRNIGSRSIVEFLRVEAVSFVVPTDSISPVVDRDFDLVPDDAFSAFGRTTPTPTTYLASGNLGWGSAADAYQSAGVITSNFSTALIALGEERVNLQSGFAFTAPDTFNRLFWVTGPVTYICNSAAGVRILRRFSGYSINANLPLSESAAHLNGGGAKSEILATNIGSCRLDCGTNQNVCQGTLVFEAIAVRATDSGNESLRILQQIPLDNRS